MKLLNLRIAEVEAIRLLTHVSNLAKNLYIVY
jgi:hypothetical protein